MYGKKPVYIFICVNVLNVYVCALGSFTVISNINIIFAGAKPLKLLLKQEHFYTRTPWLSKAGNSAVRDQQHSNNNNNTRTGRK